MPDRIVNLWRRPWLLSERLRTLCGPINRLVLRARARFAGVRLRLGEGIRVCHPVQIQGAGEIVIGAQVIFGFSLAGATKVPILLQVRTPAARLVLGERSAIMNGCEFFVTEAILIGRDCLVGQRCMFIDSDGHDLHPTRRHLEGHIAPIVLEDNVWLGARVIVLKGVHIGRDAVVAAGSVVTRAVPPGAVVAGNPARQVGSVYA